MRTDAQAVRRAGAVLDELEAAWRGRVDRMAALLAEMPESERMTVVSVDKDLEELTLVLVAEFAAPVERVWQLWADPRQLERWWGPPDPPRPSRSTSSAGRPVTYTMTGPAGETSRGWWQVRRSTRRARSSSPTASPTPPARRTRPCHHRGARPAGRA